MNKFHVVYTYKKSIARSNIPCLTILILEPRNVYT